MMVTPKGLSRFWTIFSVVLFALGTAEFVVLVEAFQPHHVLATASYTIPLAVLIISGFRYGMHRLARADAEFYAGLAARRRAGQETPQTEINDVHVYSLDDYRRDHPPD